MKAFHLRYTPYALSQDFEGFIATLSPARYAIGEEDKGRGDQSSLHFHIYYEIDECEKTQRNTITEYFKIPTCGRGKVNAYYCLKPIPRQSRETDMWKFTLGYTQKDGKTVMTNISQEEINEAVEYYWAHTAKPQEDELPAVEVEVQIKDAPIEKDTVQGLWVEYSVWMEKQLKKNPDVIQSMAWFKTKSRQWWSQRNGGLFPVTATYKRFLMSIYYQYTKNINIETEPTQSDDMGYLGY